MLAGIRSFSVCLASDSGHFRLGLYILVGLVLYVLVLGQLGHNPVWDDILTKLI